MKKIFYAALLLLTPMAFQSCDNLDLAPQDYYGAGNFWQNEAQVNLFSIGLHNNLREALVSQNMEYGELRGATTTLGMTIEGTQTRYGSYVQNQISEDTPLKSDWGGFYGKLLQVNHMIENLENGCDFLSASKKDYYKGVAYGLRAYYYFWLYRSYGGVPLELTVKVDKGTVSAPDLYMERATAEQTLKQIKEDVETSVKSFEASSDKGSSKYFWNFGASLMLKADVYLWSAKATVPDAKEPHTATMSQADLNEAMNALNKLDGLGYALVDDFASLYTNKGKKNNETILALYGDKDEYTNKDYFRRFFYHNNFNGNKVFDEEGNELGNDPLELYGEGLHYEQIRESLVKSYDKTDSRRAGTFLEVYNESGVFACYLKKFFGQNSNGTHYFDPDVILYRYAEAVLMKAEIANAMNNDPSPYINQIRQRAYGDNYSSEVAYANGTFAENELAILKERDKEFVGEGKRWFDLLRLQDADHQPLVFSKDAAYEDQGQLVPVLDKSTESYKVLWPINVSLMNNDPLLEQTVGYPTKK